MKAALVIIAVLVLAVAVVIGGWQLYWWAAKSSTANRYGVNTGTQQYQAGLISQERNLSLDWNKAVDPGQKQAIADQFCQIFPNLNPAPADLVNAHLNICT